MDEWRELQLLLGRYGVTFRYAVFVLYGHYNDLEYEGKAWGDHRLQGISDALKSVYERVRV